MAIVKLPTSGLSPDLRTVTVRPTWGNQEHRYWDRLVERCHYMPFRGQFGKTLRHVAVNRETWLALIGWHAGVFKVGPAGRMVAPYRTSASPTAEKNNFSRV